MALLNGTSIQHRLSAAFVILALLTAAAGSVGMLASWRIGEHGVAVGERLAPLGDAAMEIKLTATQAHLLFEEIMSGDDGEDINEVWSLLDETRFYTRAILEGGENDEGRFYPTDSPEVRRKIENVQRMVEAFIDSARKRYAQHSGMQGTGSGADQEFDDLYDSVLASLDELADQADQFDPAAALLTMTAVGKAKFHLANGHLFLEEVLSGDEGESFEDVLSDFETAAAALAQMEGGDVQAIKTSVERLGAVARVRHSSISSNAVAGSAADQAFDESFEAFIQVADEAEEIIHDSMDEGLADLRLAETLGIVAVVIFMLIAVGTAIVLRAQFQRNVSDRLRELALCMDDMAKGGNNRPVPGAKGTDEIGVMAKSVLVFQENVAVKQKLEAQQAEERRNAEERAKATADFQVQMSRLVDAAISGDFSDRLDTNTASKELNLLSGKVNQLVDTFDVVVRDIGGVMAALAEGDLTKRVPSTYKGRLAELQQSTNRTAEQLADIVTQIGAATNEVDSAASEISSGVEDLSNRTEQAASNLEETAASTEQMTATVKQNAENAKNASQLAGSADQVAKSGGEVVEEAVTAMSEIEQSAQKITDIISVIDEIAFQTNLLALNASVEAARAGEAGKGFAVVAQEVRQLAQRSAQAASDIKTLIQDSNGQVRNGVELVSRAGESLSKIVSSISDVAAIVNQISSASEEQALGVQEINSSVASMDEMTQQNSALVEQSTAAARALNSQSSKLNELLAFFKMGVQKRAPIQRQKTFTKPAPQRKPAPSMTDNDDGWSEF
jgi:methyl-accepting chemotaxis protein